MVRFESGKSVHSEVQEAPGRGGAITCFSSLNANKDEQYWIVHIVDEH